MNWSTESAIPKDSTGNPVSWRAATAAVTVSITEVWVVSLLAPCRASSHAEGSGRTIVSSVAPSASGP